MVAPAGTPVDVTGTAQRRHQRHPEDQRPAAEIQKLGGQIDVGTPADFSAFIATEAKRWLDVADANNIKVD